MKRVIIFLLLSTIFISSYLFAADIEIIAVVEKSNPSTGESFIYQIQIKGSDHASDFPKNNWSNANFTNSFKVDFLGGQNNSRREISIINGRRKEIITSSYIISYTLTPLISGTLTIPSVSVVIDDEKYTTRSIKIESKEAEESDSLKLLVSLEKDKAYVNEPILITFTWYIGININEFLFSIPFFQDSNFSFIDPTGAEPDPSSVVRFPIDGTSVTAVQGKGTLRGKTYTTVTFSKLIVPKTPGNFSIPKSVISVSAETSRSGKKSDMFSSFFSSFSTEYKHFSVPSNDLSLRVLALPVVGKPENFSGYIGELKIETSASPLNVRVGDPITFAIKISGPKNIADWDPTDLSNQHNLTSSFKMPSEISAGKIEGNSVVFTQTIRSLNDFVTEIPSLEIPYFDTLKGIYSVARSEGIPITVVKGSAVRVEGTVSSSISEMQQEIVQASNNGINYNYKNVNILENKSFGFKALKRFPLNLLLIIPPLFYLAVLIFTLAKKSKYFVRRLGRKNALSEISRELKKIDLNDGSEESGNKVKIVFLNFIANKLSVTSGSITEKDVKNWLFERGHRVDDFPLIFEVFSLIDEIQYAGSFLQGKNRQLKIVNLMDKVLLAVKEFEGRIPK